MKKVNSYSVLFYTKNSKENNEKKVPIYMRITINGKQVEISTKQWVDKKKWNNAGAVKGDNDEAKLINKTLESLRHKAWDTYLFLDDKYKIVTADSLKEHMSQDYEGQKSLMEVFEIHNKRVKDLVEKDYAPATLKRYDTTLKHVKDFLKFKYDRTDIRLFEIQYSFIEDFEHYFKSVRGCNHNSTLKYIKMFRKIINMAVKNEWLLRDPFARFTSKFKEVKRNFLSMEELETMQNKVFEIDRLNVVKDIFVFSCYTGLAYVDVAKLTKKNILKDEDGEYWLITKRTKTDIESNVPLLPVPLKIIEKYKNDPRCLEKGTLLPIMTNQKMNAYLKEIAIACGITNDLTFHLARHTFATTVTLAKGVPIETVSKMLGHAAIRTTQIYAKVIPQKIKEDMKQLKTKLYGSKNK
jgi:site-specific recombinase XerD